MEEFVDHNNELMNVFTQELKPSISKEFLLKNTHAYYDSTRNKNSAYTTVSELVVKDNNLSTIRFSDKAILPQIKCDRSDQSQQYRQLLRQSCFSRTHLFMPAEERSYTCLDCGKFSKYKSHLKAHLMTHIGEEPHQCQECGKRCLGKNELNRHLLTHRGNRPHKCPDCGNTFKTKSNLNAHDKIRGTARQEQRTYGKQFPQWYR